MAYANFAKYVDAWFEKKYQKRCRMKKVLIAFADVRSDKFNPVYAEFPVADSPIAEYMEGDDLTRDNKNLVYSARTMLGVSFDEPCVSGVFVDDPRGEMDVAEFFDGLKKRWVDNHAAWEAKHMRKCAAHERPTIKIHRADIPPEVLALLEHLAQR